MSFSDSKRIAKNTGVLYIRMIILMLVTLYTSRVILATLGIDDYGIYTLIGGFISIFSFIGHALVYAMQRFFNVALGQQDRERFKRIYSMGINIFILFSLLLLVIGETVGLWYVKYKMNIPPGRETAAMWVYQISIITLIVQLFRTPDNAAIIAHEKMSFYAYLSIGEAVLKLLIVFALQLFNSDKLILYVLLYLAASFVINIAYKLYCNAKFEECRYKIMWDGVLFKDMISFSGWSLLNSGSRTVTMQMENIFLNRYYSVSVNAARGVASQVYNAVNLFLTNFQTAFRPQLTKTYAAGEMDEHYGLLNRSSKFSFYLLLILVVPIAFNMDALLSLWLVDVPLYTKEFCIYVMLAYLMDALAMPLWTSIAANGNIKGVQITTAAVFVVQMFASLFALRAGWPPYIVSVFILVSHTIHYFLYLFYCKKLCGINLKKYLKTVILPLIPICVLSPVLPYILQRYTNGGIWLALGLLVIDACWILILVWLLGLDKSEKSFIRSTVTKLIRKKHE